MTRGFIAPENHSQRQLKASEVIRQALADIFSKGKHFDGYLYDKSITISQVKVSPDLKHAVVYVHPFGEIDKEKFLQSLDAVTPGIRKAMTSKINFKFSPSLAFYLDKNFDHASQIENLLKEITT